MDPHSVGGSVDLAEVNFCRVAGLPVRLGDDVMDRAV
jgi:hypothetical protein